MKRRSQPQGRRCGGKKRSSYAEKHSGRLRVESPFHPDHVTDYGHRLARIAMPALAAALEADRRRGFRGNDGFDETEAA